MIFDLSDTTYLDYIASLNQELADQYYQQKIQQQVLRQQELVKNVSRYLDAAGSPLSDYASTLVTLRNWKKIVALANAESSMCRHYPISKANCWGVGGTNRWDMGNNLGQGIVAMNRFLNSYPLNSTVKYSQMSFDAMNGLYKKPAANHWVENNQAIYNDLAKIEASL